MCATDAPRRRGAVGSPARVRYVTPTTSRTLAAGSPSAMWRPPSPQALEHSRATVRAGGRGSESGAMSRAPPTFVRSGSARCTRSRSTCTLAREPAGTAIMPATQNPISAASARPHQSRLTPTKVANRPRTRQLRVGGTLQTTERGSGTAIRSETAGLLFEGSGSLKKGFCHGVFCTESDSLASSCSTTRTRITRMSRKRPDGSVEVERSLRRTLEDFEVVDGEVWCAGARCSTVKAVLRVLRGPPRAPREIPAPRSVSADPSTRCARSG